MTGIEQLKSKYKTELEPFFEMVLERRSHMSKLVWEDLVNRFEESVLKSPDQYLSGINSTEKTIQVEVIKSLFEDLRNANDKTTLV